LAESFSLNDTPLYIRHSGIMRGLEILELGVSVLSGQFLFQSDEFLFRFGDSLCQLLTL
jgi:hypothetical protein